MSPHILGETYCFCTFCLSVSLSATKSCAHFFSEMDNRNCGGCKGVEGVK
jgi:hypothetical protein